MGVYSAGLAWELDAIQALAYCRVAVLLRSLFITFGVNQTASLNKKKPLQNAWLVYDVLVTAALLL